MEEISRPNPLVSFVVTKEEMDLLIKLSEKSGVSVAQIARGLFRIGVDAKENYSLLSLLGFGVIESQND